MGRLICTYGDKGGVGKSMAARVLAETLIAAGRNPLLVDADPTVGHLLKFLGVRNADGKPIWPQPEHGVRTYALHGSTDDRVEFGSILESGRDLILVDLPAASATLLSKIEADYGLFAWAHETGYEVTLVVSITPDAASMVAVQDAADIDPRAALVVVRNAGFGDPQKHFVVWDGSAEDGIDEAQSRKILRSRGGHEITLPALDPGTLALIGARRLTFRQAAAGEGSHVIIGARRRQVARFLDDAAAAFGECGTVLGLEPATKRSAA